MKLLGHLERDYCTEAEASEEIWALRLYAAYLVEIVRGHRLDSGMRGAPAVEALSLQCIHRLIRTQQLCKLAVNEHLAAFRVHAEERWS